MTLLEIATQISTHLSRFEADPIANHRIEGDHRDPLFWQATASVEGRRIKITYVYYQNSTKLAKKDAETYLAWLDAGNVGKHWNALHAK